ncbi:MAG: carbohydrate ABC transporter permease [Clostridiales bacterium]|nr:carbohydrate ABC transporter permease [Clostridiales bacterium]
MNARTHKKLTLLAQYGILLLVGTVMIYPLLWMAMSTFKTNADMFNGVSLLPRAWTLDGWRDAMADYGGDLDIWRAMVNTYRYVLPKVLFTVISCTLAAYGFGRFRFRGRGAMFGLMLSMLFLPQVVLNVPQYILFNQFGWINSPWYAPLIVPTMFATESYFVFMLVQFMRGIPRELDEAATIDGCGSLQTLWRVIAPLLRPALVSVALFQFMWSSNDFMGPLLYVTTQSNKPASLFVKLSMDADAGFSWNRVLAVSLISILPSLLVFFAAQKQFIDGIAAGSIKG